MKVWHLIAQMNCIGSFEHMVPLFSIELAIGKASVIHGSCGGSFGHVVAHCWNFWGSFERCCGSY